MLLYYALFKLARIALALACFPMSSTSSVTESENRIISVRVGLKTLELTDHDANKSEHEKLADHQEGEIPCNDSAVQARPRQRAWIFPKPAHDTGKKDSEEARDCRWDDTGNDGERDRRMPRPVVQEWQVSCCRDLQQR